MTQFLTGAPVWVWPLLLLLILVGLRARQARSVPVVLIYLLPLLGLLALRSTAALPADNWIWLVFGGGYAAGVWAGHHLQARWVRAREGARVRLAGENLTLVVMMVIFWANFAGGVLREVAPAVYGMAAFQVILVLLVAASAGSFAGRALRVWRGV